MLRASELREAASRAADHFGEAFADATRLARDREAATELAIEARAVFESLLAGLAAAPDPRSHRPELREALALVSLLGRRAGELGVTPSAALALAPAIVAAASAESDASLDPIAGPIAELTLEGFVMAREDRLREDGARALAGAIPIVEAAPGCVVMIAGGAQSAEELERVVEELGRRLLNRDAKACLVDASELPPSPELARPLFAAHVSARMLGTRCLFTGLDDARWASPAREAGLTLGELERVDRFAEGLRVALETCDLELRHRSGLGNVIRRLLDRE